MDIDSPDKLARIRELNDKLRTTGIGGKIMMTRSVANLPEFIRHRALKLMREFDDFNLNNDPHHEHDCFSFKESGYTFMVKIDYYDKSLEFGSEDPANPDVTTRVCNLMLAEDY